MDDASRKRHRHSETRFYPRTGTVIKVIALLVAIAVLAAAIGYYVNAQG